MIEGKTVNKTKFMLDEEDEMPKNMYLDSLWW